jgi:hypothetical protein
VQTIQRTMLFLAALGGLAGRGDAAIVFSQTPAVNTAHASDVDFPFFLADDFSLAASETVNEVTWRGFYFPTGTPQLSDVFTIDFHADSGGSPGALLQSFVVGNAVNRTGTGTFFGPGIEYFDYSANLGAGISLSGATQYWLSIFNDTSIDTNDGWHWGILLDGGNSQSRPTTADPWGPSNHAAYFTLAADEVADVPAPASLILWGMGGGLAFLGKKLRRGRKTDAAA